MNVDEYQTLASRTRIYPGLGTRLGLAYTALGLVNELSEFVEATIDGGRDHVVAEAGDVLWYAAMLASEMDMHLSEVMDGSDWPEAHSLGAPLPDPWGAMAAIAGRVKKIIRDGDSTTLRADLRDLLRLATTWLCVVTEWETGVSPERVAAANIDKLADRQTRGVLRGDGDHR